MMPVSSVWIFARLSLCDTPWVSKNVGALVGPSGRPGNRSHKPRAGQSVNYSVGHVEPLSLLPDIARIPHDLEQGSPFRCFRQPYIARSAGREIFGGSYRSRGFARSASAALGRQGVILSPTRRLHCPGRSARRGAVVVPPPAPGAMNRRRSDDQDRAD